MVDEAWPGDIIGIPNHGVLRVGDTLSERARCVFTGIPNFAPEILRRVRLGDPMKAKHLARALEGLAEEGVTQVFKPQHRRAMDRRRGRAAAARRAQVAAGAPNTASMPISSLRPTTRRAGCRGADADLEKFVDANRGGMATDRDGAPVFLAKSAWEIGYVADKFPNIKFAKTRERHDVNAEG